MLCGLHMEWMVCTLPPGLPGVGCGCTRPLAWSCTHLQPCFSVALGAWLLTRWLLHPSAITCAGSPSDPPATAQILSAPGTAAGRYLTVSIAAPDVSLGYGLLHTVWLRGSGLHG